MLAVISNRQSGRTISILNARRLSVMLLGLLTVMLLACTGFLYPMNDPENAEVKLEYAGVWLEEGKDEGIALIPWDSRTYMMSFIEITDNEMTYKGAALAFKAFIHETENQDFLSLQYMPAGWVFNPAVMDAEDEKALLSLYNPEILSEETDSQQAEALMKTRYKNARQIMRNTGRVPMYMIGRITREKDQLKLQIFPMREWQDMDEATQNEVLKLNSMDKVRDYVMDNLEMFEESDWDEYQLWRPKSKANR